MRINSGPEGLKKTILVRKPFNMNLKSDYTFARNSLKELFVMNRCHLPTYKGVAY